MLVTFTHLHTVKVAVGVGNQSHGVQRCLSLNLFRRGERAFGIFACQRPCAVVEIAFLAFDQPTEIAAM